MTRAEKRLYVSWARYRRRFGGGQPEVCIPSRFLNEVPVALREKLSPYAQPFTEEVDLYGEQHAVRESVKKNLYTGRTYNSVDNIAQFFAERGMPPPSGLTRRPPVTPPAPAIPTTVPAAVPATRPAAPSVPATRPPAQLSFPQTAATQPSGARSMGARKQVGFAVGTTINHPKYGPGKILRREGEGEDAKLTISFPGYGLKKIVEKYAGIKINE
jgi:DNA helicase-2/ATP-dependent DNA helicase PcrA